MADIQYKCPNCGGSLTFNSSSQKVCCEFCGAEFDPNEVKKHADELAKAESPKELQWEEGNQASFSQEELDGLNVYHCDSCGGELIADDNTSATTCPYCGNPVILKGRLQGALKPDRIIPFKNAKKDLDDTFRSYLKKKVFLPNIFKRENQVEEIKGLYVPFWLHDASVRGDVYYKGMIERKWRDSTYEYTEKSYYSITRGGSMGFDHIPIDGSKALDDKLMESIEPFDYEESVPFEPVYMAGFLSDKYDVDKEEVFPRASERIVQGTIDQFRTTISGYDEVNYESHDLELYDTKVTYALYPVWIMTTRWREKSYTFAMNGQTNKIVGNLPLSKWKYFFMFLGLLIGTWGLLLPISIFAIFEGEVNAISMLVPLVLAWIPSVIVCHKCRKALKPVKFQRGARNYYRNGSMVVSKSSERFLYKKTSKRALNNN